MAWQGGNPVNQPISPHVIAGAFVKQYYQILHEQLEQAHKFYQDSSILGRPDSNGTMVYISTMSAINEKIMSMDFRNCLTVIETVDAQLSHKDGVLIVVTGSLTLDGVFRWFTQSFFLAPQESGGYFVVNDIFRFISERKKPAEINQVATQKNEINRNGRPTSETCSALQEPIPADKSVISDHATAENNVTKSQVSDPSTNGIIGIG